jgi:hypothetical protein
MHVRNTARVTRDLIGHRSARKWAEAGRKVEKWGGRVYEG